MRNLPLDDLLRGSRWWTISICIEEVLKHIKSWTLCVYFVCERVCVCLILCNTWIGPKADVGEHAGPCPTLLAWFGETVSRPIKIVTALFHKAWHVYMWFRITDRFQLVSVRTKEAGSNLAFGTQKEYQSLFFCRKLEFIDYITSLWAPSLFLSFFFPVIIILLWRAGLFVMKSKWRRFWLLALSPPVLFLPWGGLSLR